MTIPASPREHALITTNPVERAHEEATDHYADWMTHPEEDRCFA